MKDCTREFGMLKGFLLAHTANYQLIDALDVIEKQHNANRQTTPMPDNNVVHPLIPETPASADTAIDPISPNVRHAAAVLAKQFEINDAAFDTSSNSPSNDAEKQEVEPAPKKRRRGKLDDEKREDICVKYEAGDTPKQLAAFFEVSEAAIYDVLKKKNVTLRGQKKGKKAPEAANDKKTIPLGQSLVITNLISKGVARTTIQEMYGVTAPTLKEYLDTLANVPVFWTESKDTELWYMKQDDVPADLIAKRLQAYNADAIEKRYYHLKSKKFVVPPRQEQSPRKETPPQKLIDEHTGYIGYREDNKIHDHDYGDILKMRKDNKTDAEICAHYGVTLAYFQKYMKQMESRDMPQLSLGNG